MSKNANLSARLQRQEAENHLKSNNRTEDK